MVSEQDLRGLIEMARYAERLSCSKSRKDKELQEGAETDLELELNRLLQQNRKDD